MRKKFQIKKEHHYVWANYLLNWSCDGTNLWFATPKRKLIFDSARMVAKERFFYKVRPLTQEHLSVIELYLTTCEIKDYFYSLLDDFIKVQRIEAVLMKNQCCDNESKLRLEAYRHNTLENYHSGYECRAKPIVDRLVTLDLACLNDDTNVLLLSQYLGQQFARTKSFKQLALLAMSKRHNNTDAIFIHRNTTECWWFISHMIGHNLGLSIYSDRHVTTTSLLFNNTKQSFITSDQPVINIHPELTDDIDTPPEDHQFDLYYPLSSKVALVICNSGQFKPGIVNVSVDVVDRLNITLAHRAYVHIFGTEQAAVEPYKRLVGKQYLKVKKWVDDN